MIDTATPATTTDLTTHATTLGTEPSPGHERVLPVGGEGRDVLWYNGGEPVYTDEFTKGWRYGSTFTDELTGLRVGAYHPLINPLEWQAYLDGAERVYRARSVGSSLARVRLEDGEGIHLFFVVWRGEEAVGGIRYHGPFESIGEAPMVAELAASEEIEDLRGVISASLGDGALEMKGMWAVGAKTLGYKLSPTLIRTALLACAWLGASRSFATTDARLVGEVEAACGLNVHSTRGVAYPSEAYDTRLVSLTWESTMGRGDADWVRALLSSAAELREGSGCAGEASSRAVVFSDSRRDGVGLRRALTRMGGRIIDASGSMLAERRGLVGASGEVGSLWWAYYPWSATLVRVLGPGDFGLVRLDRNRNKLTREEQFTLRALTIGVVGASAGHVIAHTLALEGIVGELRITDFDSIDLTNLNRIPARLEDVGINKAVVVARRVGELDPYIKVYAGTQGVTPTNIESFITGCDIIIEECDELDVKVRVREVARRLGIPVVMETSDRGTLDVERFDLEENLPLLHGRLGGITADELRGLSAAEKGPYAARLLGTQSVSARGVASLLEMGVGLGGWPQLGSEVTLGGASVAAVVRRIGLGKRAPSGRVRIDVEESIDALAPAPLTDTRVAHFASPAPVDVTPSEGDAVTYIVDAARRAPSGGNVQPWRFEASESEIRFYVDLGRSEASMDVQGRASYVAVGAALLNARVRASALDCLGAVTLLPEGVRSRHVGTVAIGTGREPLLVPLDPMISRRVSNRQMGQRREISPESREVLERAVRLEGGRLRLVSDARELTRGGEIIGESDRRRFLLTRVHEEMISELRWPGFDNLKDGLDVRTLEFDAGLVAVFDLLSRGDVMDELSAARAGGLLGANSRSQIEGASALALISVPRGGRVGYLQGGSALERFWLEGERLGIAMTPHAPVYQFATSDRDLLSLGGERFAETLRDQQVAFNEYWGLGGDEMAILVLRLFHARAPGVRSVRRSLDEVLIRG